MGSGAHFNTMCFSFAGKTVATDANQLQDLREFLRAGDGDSFRRFIENLNPSPFAEQSRINYQRIIIHSTTETRLTGTHSLAWVDGV